MERTRFLWGLLLLGLTFLVAALFTNGIEPAHAAFILVQQTDVSSSSPVSTYTLPPYSFNGYALPGGIEGILNEVDVAASYASPSAQINVQILCFTDRALSNPCDSSWGSGSGNLFSDGGNQTISAGSVPLQYAFTYTNYDTSHRTMHAGDFYVLEFQTSNPNVLIYGDAAHNPAYIFYGDTTDTTTRIVQINSPLNGAILGGNTVNFSFDYYFNSASSTYTTAGIQLTDNTSGQSLIAPPFAAIISDGESTYTATSTLTFGHSYSWTPELDGGTSTPLLGTTYTFTLSNNTATTTVPDFFSGLWGAIQNNPPFAFIFQIRNQLLNLNASSTPAVDLNLAQFEIDSIFHPFDLALASVIYFVFAVWLFKRAQHLDL